MAEDKSLKESLLAASPFLLKIFQIVLVLFSLGLIIPPFGNKLQPSNGRAGFIYSIYTSALLVDCLIIGSHFLGERISKKPCLVVATFFGVFLMVTGTMVIQDWRMIQTTLQIKPSKYYMDMMIASGVFSMFSSAAFFTDIFFTIKYG